ncbi:MAG: hypothetical protein LC130_33560 [Bryobacterales bacterium]|nr:hypothetical protein [Bryobacterales bacterium]
MSSFNYLGTAMPDREFSGILRADTSVARIPRLTREGRELSVGGRGPANGVKELAAGAVAVRFAAAEIAARECPRQQTAGMGKRASSVVSRWRRTA